MKTDKSKQHESGWNDYPITARVVIESACNYIAYLQRLETINIERQSKHNTLIDVGEIDDPDNIDPKLHENRSLNAASVFALMTISYTAKSMIHPDLDERIKIDDEIKTRMISCIQQLIFAIASNNEALSVMLHHQRTGLLGFIDCDDADIHAVKNYFFKMTKKLDGFQKLVMDNNFESQI